jgi:DNA topoisomerase IB
MQVRVDIEFDELLKVVKTLPSKKLKQLKDEIEKKTKTEKSSNLETLLLNGPVATKKQLETIAKNRKAINQWRTKKF